MPRKLKLNREVIASIVKFVELGMPLKFAAEAVGVSERTIHRWLEEGHRTHRGLKWQLCQEIEKARARMIARKLALVEKAAQNGSWQAAAWLLERRFPEHFGRRDKLEHEGGVRVIVEMVDADAGEED